MLQTCATLCPQAVCSTRVVIEYIIWLAVPNFVYDLLKPVTQLSTQRPDPRSLHLLVPQRPCITAQVKT